MSPYTTLDTPVGTIHLYWNDDNRKLTALDFPGPQPTADAVLSEPPAWLEPLLQQLREYFTGKPLAITSDLVDLETVTPFRRAIYEYLLTIPPGETRTYGDVARAIGSPGAARAIGNAMAANRLPILVPCHRVLASNGLGGYTSGLETKRYLLRLEQHPLFVE